MSTSEPIILNWRPLLHVSEFPKKVDCSKVNAKYKDTSPRSDYKLMPCPSVYIWGFVHCGEFIPYCVGKTGRPFERAMQHYSNLRGGLYPIYHRNSLREFYLHKNDHEPEGVKKRWVESLGFRYDPGDHVIDAYRDKGMLYTPCSPYAQWHDFMHPNVQREVAYQTDAFRFAWAEICGKGLCGSVDDGQEESKDDTGGRDLDARDGTEPGEGVSGDESMNQPDNKPKRPSITTIAESALADRLGRRYLQSDVHRFPATGSEYNGPSLLHCCAGSHAGPLVTKLVELEGKRDAATGRTGAANDKSWACGPVVVPWGNGAG